jgi:hypothetical protein
MDVADRTAAILSNKPYGVTPVRLFTLRRSRRNALGFEGLAMTEGATSWFDKARRLGRSHLATQAAVLLPVVAIAGLTAWTMLSTPIRARSQASSQETMSTTQATTQGTAAPQRNAALETAPAAPPSAAPTDQPAVSGLKISSQSWRRGGLGSNALVTFTLRNDNNYPVKDIEIACAFSRQDGSHLTDRKRVIPDAVVNTKSRKTFAQIHIGFVNIYANKAKCAPIAANRI